MVKVAFVVEVGGCRSWLWVGHGCFVLRSQWLLWCEFAALFLVGLVVVVVVKQWVLVWWCLILLVVVWLRERER